MKNGKYVLITMLFLIVPLKGMQNISDCLADQQAKHIKKQLMVQSAKSADSFIAATKEYLNDQSLTSKNSNMVKQALLDTLATNVCWTQSASCPLKNLDTAEYRVTQFWDGTQTIEELVYVYPLDLIDQAQSTKIQNKSRGGALSFEDYLRYIFSFKNMPKDCSGVTIAALESASAH